MQVYKFHFYKLNTYGRKSKKLHERKTVLLLNTVYLLDFMSQDRTKKNPMHPNHMKITLHAPNTTTVAWPAIMEWH